MSYQASLEHENVTELYHSYIKLLPQNILQLQLHFSCTLYSINNLKFTKIRVVGIVGYHYMFLILKCFWLYSNLNEVVSVGSNLIRAVVIWPNIYNIPRMQIWMKHFQFAQMVPIVPKFEWSSFNYPNMIEAVGICPNVCNCMQI